MSFVSVVRYNLTMRKHKSGLEDLTGRTFSRLVVRELLLERTPRGSRVWRCDCDCGNMHLAITPDLKDGSVKSCGCLKSERDLTGNIKHGKKHTPEYGVWSVFRDRCNNPRNKGYANYGGRGIQVCVRWDDFRNFIADMGERPSPKHSIDRIDNDGDYSPENCRWANRTDQNRNRRITKRVEFSGQSLTLGEWAERTGIPYGLICSRLWRGWSPDRTLTTIPTKS